MTRQRPQLSVSQWLDDADDEILKGVTILPESKRRSELQQWLDQILRPWFQGRIHPASEPIAERWCVLAGQSQLRGRHLEVVDGFIAATAIERDLTLVTRNVKDFAGLGVAVLNPWDVA